MRFPRRVEMLNLSTISILIGAAFGMRFGVFVLVPVIALELALVALTGFAAGESAIRLALVMSLVATSVQMGFLGGTLVDATLAAEPWQQPAQ
jgi:hypothetical protein